MLVALLLLLVLMQQLTHDDTNPVALENIMLSATKNSRYLDKTPNRKMPHIMVDACLGVDVLPGPRRQ